METQWCYVRTTPTIGTFFHVLFIFNPSGGFFPFAVFTHSHQLIQLHEHLRDRRHILPHGCQSTKFTRGMSISITKGIQLALANTLFDLDSHNVFFSWRNFVRIQIASRLDISHPFYSSSEFFFNLDISTNQEWRTYFMRTVIETFLINFYGKRWNNAFGATFIQYRRECWFGAKSSLISWAVEPMTYEKSK